MKEVGLLIDLYQSSTLEESALRRVASEFFIPLIKIIKSLKNIKVSLNIPLSTLELLDFYGYQSVIFDIKDLYENERVELVGSAAYNPLLINTHSKIIENEIILNEYALGNYFGSKHGFEGEPSMMVKDISGFVPTGLLVNKDTLDVLSDLNYSWVLADKSCISNSLKGEETTNNFVYKYNSLKVITPNKEINALINSFNVKDFDEIWSLFKQLKLNADKVALVIKNDIEHLQEDIVSDFYKKKINLIDRLLENLCKENISITNIREISKNINLEAEVILVDDNSIGVGTIYRQSLEESNDLIGLISKIDNELKASVASNLGNMTQDDYSTLCLWKDDELKSIEDNNIHNKVCFDILLYRFMSIDKYIYSYVSNTMENGQELSKNRIRKYMNYVEELIKYKSDESFTNVVLPLVNDIEKLI